MGWCRPNWKIENTVRKERKRNIEFKGGKNKNYDETIKTAKDCRDMCNKVRKCERFEYTPSSNRCILAPYKCVKRRGRCEPSVYLYKLRSNPVKWTTLAGDKHCKIPGIDGKQPKLNPKICSTTTQYGSSWIKTVAAVKP